MSWISHLSNRLIVASERFKAYIAFATAQHVLAALCIKGLRPSISHIRKQAALQQAVYSLA